MKAKTNHYTKITSVFIAVLLTFFLFCFGSGGYESISTVKRNAFFVVCGGYCAVILGLIGYRLAAKKSAFKGFRQLLADASLAQLFAVLYLLFTLLATLLSPFRSYAWLGASRGEGFLTIAIYCLTFLFVSQFASVKKWMVWLLGASCLAFSCICVLQLQSINVFSLFPGRYTYWDGGVAYNGRYIGTIGNVDHVASFLSLAIPILWCAIVRLQDRKRFWLLIPLALLVYVLVRIDVSAGMLAVFGGFLFCLPVVLKGPKKLRLALVLLLVFLIVFGLVFVRVHDFGNQTLHEAHELLNGKADRTFGTGRMYIWTEVMKRAALRMPFGYGPDTMVLTGIEPFQRYDELSGKTLVSLIDSAHNEYLNVLFHQGIFALFSFLCMIAVSLTGWIKKAQESVPAAILGCGVLCYCIQALFGISQPITSPFFWVTLALLAKSCSIPISSVLHSQSK